MKAFVNQIFMPHTTLEDEKSRFARLLIAEMMGFIVLYLIALAWIFLGAAQFQFYNRILGFTTFSILLSLFLIHRGWLRSAGNWFLFSTYLSVTFAIIRVGSILAPMTGVYIFLVISSGLLFGRRGVIISAGSSSMAILGIYYAQLAGWLPIVQLQPSLLNWFTYTLIICVTGLLSQYAYHFAREALIKANDALHLSQAIVQSAPVGILIYLADGRCISANQAASQILGRSVEKLLQDDFHHLSSWRDSGIYASAQHALESGQPSEHRHVEFNALSGYHLWLKYVFAPFSQAGSMHLLMIFEDESKQHKAEATLRESEQMLRAVINSPTSYVIRTDNTGHFTFWNERYMQDYGWLHPEGLGGENPLATIAEHHHERTHQVVKKCIAQPGIVFQVDLDKIRANQEIRATLWDFVCLPDPEGKPGEIQCVGIDITDLKMAQETIRQSNERFEELAHRIEEVFWVTDHNQKRVEYISPGVEKIFGIEANTLVEHPGIFDQNLGPEELQLMTRTRQAEQAGETTALEYRYNHPDGSQRWIWERSSPVKDAQGIVLRTVGVSSDITARKQAELLLSASEEKYRLLSEELEQRVRARTTELRESNQALQNAVRARDEFLAAVSHELRTPLTGILGGADALNMYGDLTAKQAKAVQIIDQSGRRLLSTVNDVLDYTQLQSSQPQLQIQLCQLGSVCQSCLVAVKSRLEAKNQRIEFSIQPEKIELRLDERRIRQVIFNLLDNAIKFTPDEGLITLAVESLPAEGVVQVIVSDTGIGIAAENIERLFQPFVQFDGRLTRQYEGTGLGLALVKTLVDLHGGSIRVESELRKGSRFTIRLPLA